MRKNITWTWFFSKGDHRCLGYLYNPYQNRDKKDLLETLGLINECVYDPKLVRLVHEE